MLKYLIDAKVRFDDGEKAKSRQLFISAYNENDRARHLFDSVNANSKCWWMLPEYGYSTTEYPIGNVVSGLPEYEADAIAVGMQMSGFDPSAPVEVCIDITGFLHHHILSFLKYFSCNPVPKLEFAYTEPEHYSRKVDTQFSLDETAHVRGVAGFDGAHVPEMTNDIVIVGIGYDHSLVGQVLSNKESARIVQMHCFPSLSADMYQESILRLDKVSSISNQNAPDLNYFATANDPYVTAAVLSEAYGTLSRRQPITNLYLCPLSTKPQALGFGLYYLSDLRSSPASIIYPFTSRYSRQTSTGIGHSWLYPVTL